MQEQTLRNQINHHRHKDRQPPLIILQPIIRRASNHGSCASSLQLLLRPLPLQPDIGHQQDRVKTESHESNKTHARILFFFTWAAVKVTPTLISPWYELSAVTTLYLAGFSSDVPFSMPMLIRSATLILHRQQTGSDFSCFLLLS